MQITWSTEDRAPCSPGEIIAADGRTILIDSDWEYCSTASMFGWSVRFVQKCRCGHIWDDAKNYHEKEVECPECGNNVVICDHATDGTVNCHYCLMNADEFMRKAWSWLIANHGATANDDGCLFPEQTNVNMD